MTTIRITFNVIVNDKMAEDVHVGELIDMIDVLVETGDMDQKDYEECLSDRLNAKVFE